MPRKWELPERRSGSAASKELLARRAAALVAPNAYGWNGQVDRSERLIGGVRSLVLTPPDAAGTLVYFHGGGFRGGSPERSGPFASQLACQAGCRIVLPAYGLAPENPFPAALHDGDAVLRDLAGGGDLMIGGDSAGGNLAAVLTCLHAEGLGSSLRGLLLFSPWLDLTVSGASYAANAASDALFSRSAALDAASLYLQGYPATEFMASPLFAALDGLPPALVIASCTEVLLDDSLAFAHRLASANVELALHAIPDMAHVAATLSPHLGGAGPAFDLAAGFLHRQFREGR